MAVALHRFGSVLDGRLGGGFGTLAGSPIDSTGNTQEIATGERTHDREDSREAGRDGAANSMMTIRELPDDEPTRVLDTVTGLVDERFGGIATRPHLTAVYIGRKAE